MSRNMRFTSNMPAFVARASVEADIGMAEAATDVHRRSDMLAPQLSGNLKASGRIERIKAGVYIVVYGGSANGFAVPYAKRRHYENASNPQTLFYLERAGDSVKQSGISKYIRKIA